MRRTARGSFVTKNAPTIFNGIVQAFPYGTGPAPVGSVGPAVPFNVFLEPTRVGYAESYDLITGKIEALSSNQSGLSVNYVDWALNVSGGDFYHSRVILPAPLADYDFVASAYATYNFPLIFPSDLGSGEQLSVGMYVGGSFAADTNNVVVSGTVSVTLQGERKLLNAGRP